MTEVSRNTQDHRARIEPGHWGKPRVAAVKVESDGTHSMATCSCGWESGLAKRRKVSETRAQSHLNKRHQGLGVWL